jgi:DNA-binding NarL/FixJ family response regulator
MESRDAGDLWASRAKRLVVVADNSLIVEAIRIGLRKSGGFKLVGYADGRTTSARTILDAEPEVILLDDMDRSEQALELIRAIRAEDEQIAMIVLGLVMTPDWLEEIFDAGATGAISKAVQPAALATLVRETLNGHIVHKFSGVRSANADGDKRSSAAAEDSPLTDRELEILQLAAAGSTNGEIARGLWVTEQTVKFHLRNIYRKLEVANRTQASHYAHINGLLNAQPELKVVS